MSPKEITLVTVALLWVSCFGVWLWRVLRMWHTRHDPKNDWGREARSLWNLEDNDGNANL